MDMYCPDQFQPEEYTVPVGVDYGTNHTVISMIQNGSSVPITIKDESGIGLHCSAIYYNVDPKKENIFGQAALDMMPNDNVITCIKRAMGVTSTKIIANKLPLSFNAKMITTGNAYPKFAIKQLDENGEEKEIAISALKVVTDLLTHYKKLIENEVGSSKTSYVVSMPEHWGVNSVKMLKTALVNSGIMAELITEPTGTHFAYRAAADTDKSQFLVVDLGDGTLDISLLHEVGRGNYKTIAVGGSEFVGSRDIDHIFLQNLEIEMRQDTTFNEEIFKERTSELLQKMKTLKHKLSQIEEANEVIYGITEKGFTFKVNRVKKKMILAPFYKKVEACISEVFEKKAAACGGMFTAASIKESVDVVYLAGGGNRDPEYGDIIIPKILPKAKIVGKVGTPGSINPDVVVSFGATYWAASQLKMPLKFGLPMEAIHMRVLSKNLGVEGITTSLTGEETRWFCVIIPANSVIPISKIDKRFTTSIPDQSNIEVKVFQGDGRFTSDPNVDQIGAYTIPLETPNFVDGSMISVELKVSDDGVLTVSAGQEGEEMKETKINIDF